MGMRAKVQIVDLMDKGDARGASFTVPAEAITFLGRNSDIHVASIRPGAIRGNHYHLRRRAVIVVLPGSKWSLHWDEDEHSCAQHQHFNGKLPVLLLISPGASHALRNDGDRELWWFSLSSEPYDPAESVARKVV